MGLRRYASGRPIMSAVEARYTAAEARITLRPPTHSSAQPTRFKAPPISWLAGTWHVTHATLPMWKSKRNVRIAYTPLDPSDVSIAGHETDRLDDLVSYQSLSGDKVHTVHGLDQASGVGAWDWRGKGLLKIASSHWEVLGWGDEPDVPENQWVVTYFAKTLFTPAGVDLYSRQPRRLTERTVEDITRALMDIEDLKELASEIFGVDMDEGS
ncbi:hypothetical protein LTR66_008303 [Elasticomyces elasticus]|nr:hypothetical protein LTR66_008303 [Elasticomyces elasticus]